MSTKHRLLLVSMNFAPELTGIGKYSGEMAVGLAARGHDVRVVCAPPYYPQWAVHSGYAGRGFHTEHAAPGLAVIRCPTWIPKNPRGVARLLHLVSFALSSAVVLMRSLSWRPQAVIVIAPALMSAPVACLVARLCGASSWLHLQDLEVDAAFDMGLLKGDLSRRLALAAERWLLRRFDTVSSISERMLQAVRAKGVDTRRTLMVRNWVDGSLFHGETGMAECRSRLGLGAQQVVCLYSGTLNRKQGLPVLVEAARALRHRTDIAFVICGNGELRGPLEDAARDLPNVMFLDLQPVSELPQMLAMADIHLLPQLRCAADLVMPSKLGGMFASGRPVVAGASPGTEIAKVVDGKGLVVEAESVGGFVEAIQRLADNADLRRRLGAAGRDYAQAELDAGPVLDAVSSRLHRSRRPRGRGLAPQMLESGAVATSGTSLGEGTRVLPEALGDVLPEPAKERIA